jgi:hypothetical protein
MHKWIRSHLTYANVMSTLAVFLVIGGGTALASYVVSSNSQVGPDTISGHHEGTNQHNIISGTVNATDIATGGVVSRNVNDESLTGADIANGKLTGADIAKNSGVDTCQTPLVASYGRICAGSSGAQRQWDGAANYCSDLGLRLPSLSEAITLARNYDVPGVGTNQYFWTDQIFSESGHSLAIMVREDGYVQEDGQGIYHQVVCVADPTN